MDRRGAILGIAATGFLPYALAQQAKLRRIGMLWPLGRAETPASRLAAFQQGLRELGYIEGKNVALEHKWAEGRPDRLASLAVELVQQNVDLIVPLTTAAALAAQKATKTIPIVFINVPDPVTTRLVASLARPGGNVTGVTNLSDSTPLKQFDLLLTTLPGLTRLAVLSNPAHPISPGLLASLEAPAEKRNVRLIKVAMRSPAEMDAVFASMAEQRAEALIVLPDPSFFQHRKQLAALAAKTRLPAIYPESGFVQAGALMSYGANFDSLYRQAGRYVDRILKGAKPAELAVEQPSVLELVINRRAAKMLGIAFPREVLVAADRVID